MCCWCGYLFVDVLWWVVFVVYFDFVVELDGIVVGIGWLVEDIFLWNCCGELIYNVLDGCMMFVVCDVDGMCWIVYNEDGDLYLCEWCLFVDV